MRRYPPSSPTHISLIIGIHQPAGAAVDNNISMTRRDSCEKDLCGTHPHNNNNHDKAPRFLNTIIAAALDLFACSILSHHPHKHNARLSCEFAEFSTINHDEGQLLARYFCLLSGVQWLRKSSFTHIKYCRKARKNANEIKVGFESFLFSVCPYQKHWQSFKDGRSGLMEHGLIGDFLLLLPIINL